MSRRGLLQKSLSLSLTGSSSTPATPKRSSGRPKLTASTSMDGSSSDLSTTATPKRGLLKKNRSAQSSRSIGGSTRNLISGSTRSLFSSSGRKRKIQHNVSFGDRMILEVDFIDEAYKEDCWYSGDELAELARLEIKGCKKEQKRVGKGNSIEGEDRTWRGLEDARDKICRVEKALVVTKRVLTVHKAQVRKKGLTVPDAWQQLRETYKELSRPDAKAAAKMGASDAAMVKELWPDVVQDPKPRKGGLSRSLSGMVKTMSSRSLAKSPASASSRSASRTRKPASGKDIPKLKVSRANSTDSTASSTSKRTAKTSTPKTLRTCNAPTTPKPSRKKLLAPTVDRTKVSKTSSSSSSSSKRKSKKAVANGETVAQ